MNALRGTYLSRILALATGIVFLNMGFFAGEVTLLNLDKSNPGAIEKLVKMLSTSTAEEEADGGGESEESFEDTLDLHLITLSYQSNYDSADLNKNMVSRNCMGAGQVYYETSTPPPRV